MEIAHKYEGKTQSLSEHLHNVAVLSCDFAKKAGLDTAHMKQIAELHDFGKCSVEFQDYINNKGHKVSHSNKGGLLLSDKDVIGAFCVFGHHTGLPDYGTNQDVSRTFQGRCKNEKQGDLHYLRPSPQINAFLPQKTRSINSLITFDSLLETRMYLSCLVDADWQDSAEHVETLKTDTWDAIYERFFTVTNKKFIHAEKNEINKWRTEIFNECRTAGRFSPHRVMSLSAPTGGGKTLASMAFALERVKRGDANRIIYCIPYTSIIEQNAEEYRNILGKSNVIEHHSLAEYNSQYISVDDYKQWTVDNWNSPVVLTTNVQFFESLFSAHPRRVRKLHNIANSVIILDEAQMLPRGFLKPFREMLKLLVEKYNCTVVLCTATQPVFNIGEVEILSDVKQLHERFRRVVAKNIKGVISLDDLAERIVSDKGRSVLCIVNKRDTARELYQKVKGLRICYHLSLNMCAIHREKILCEIKTALENKEPICVISTSLIEAGVDVSFDVGYRELNGLDHIIQTGGRVNRHGESKDGVLYVFRLAGERYHTPEQVEANRLLGRDVFSEDVVTEYFNALYSYFHDFDKNGVMEATERIQFREVEHKVKLIDDDQQPVIVRYDEEAGKVVEQLQHEKLERKDWRKLQRYVVTISANMLGKLSCDGAVKIISDNVYVLEEGWYDECGLRKEI